MANIYLKKVASSTRSEWTSGTSYVAGDRVYLTSATIENVHPNGTVFAAIRTFVCLADNSSTTSPEDDSINWIEAGISKEYPYHSIDGALDSDNINNEIYLEREATRYATQAARGSTYYHLRRGETEFSLGKLIIVSDTESNPVFKIIKQTFVAGFAIEPDESIERFSVVCIGNANLGSNGTHGDHDSQYGKIDKCDIYLSGNSTRIIGELYQNQSKIEFTDCLFSEQASKVGYADCNATSIGFGNRNFVGFKRCSFFFPSIPYKSGANFVYDTHAHSTGQNSFIISCSMWFKSFDHTRFIYNYRDGTLFKDNIFYFSTSDGQEIQVVYSAINNLDDSSNNILYVADNSATFNFQNELNSSHTPEYYSDRFIVKDPLYVLNSDDPTGLQLRPSSPLIGGLLGNDNQRDQIESEYPQGKWFDSNAAAGGDGSWETPYNNYAEAINSFTGDEAVVLIKEGQHELRRGYWNGSSWQPEIDLPKSYPGGIKFIGMGSDTIFTTDSDVTGYGAFFMYQASDENLQDTPFIFKDFDVLLNNVGILNRGLIAAYKAEYINVNVSQAPNLGSINSNLFDYTMSSNAADGHYLKMSNCTINVSQSVNGTSTNFLLGAQGTKQFKGCTFVDLNRTTSTSAAAPDSFMHHNFGSTSDSYLHDCIIYSKTPNTQHFGTNPTAGAYQGSTNLDIKNLVVYSTNQTVSVGSNFGDNVLTSDPQFIATEPHDFDLRLRPSSPLIGGLSESRYAPSAIWVQQGSGTGTGTKDDPFYWSQYSDAFLAATQTTSKQVVFKDGEYGWTSAVLQDDNVGNSITMIAENMHKALFHDNSSRLSSSGKNPTLRLKGIQLETRDHFTWKAECHYVLDSCHFLIGKYFSAHSIDAKGCIFEVGTGVDMYIFSNSGELDVQNCIFTDHNDRQSAYTYLTRGDSGSIKNCIFYTKQARDNCLNPGSTVTLVNCATQNITSPESGVLFADNIQFIDIENKNYNLRPLSPLIGQGK